MKQDKWLVIAMWVSWLIIVNLFAMLVMNRFNLLPDTAYTWMDPQRFSPAQGMDFVGMHAHWDTEWYENIARHGYSYVPGALSNVSFFPFLPMLMRAGGWVMGGNVILAGWIINVMALAGALWYLLRLVREFHPKIDASRTLWYLLIFPTAFFLNAVYTESLFLLCSVAAFYHVRRQEYLLGGLLGAAAAFTRVTGVLLLLPFLIEAWQVYGVRMLRKKEVYALALIPLAFLSFFAFHWWKFGDATVFFKTQRVFGRGFAVNMDHLLLQTPPAYANLALDVLLLACALWCVVGIFRRVRVSYGVYTLAGILVPLSTGTLMSLNRYALVLFPLYLWLASRRSDVFHRIWPLVSVLLLGANIMLFVNEYWAG